MLKLVNSHFIDQFNNRFVNEPKIPRKLLPEIQRKCFKVLDDVSHNRELVIIDDLQIHGINLWESEVCVIVENGQLKTIWRRNENSPKTEYGSRVDYVRWCY